MQIVFLDAHTLNPGDLSWEQFEQFGRFTAYTRTKAENVVQRAKDADVLIVNKVPLGESHFAELPNLRLICVVATGYDVIDVEAARRYGITVCNAAGYAAPAVAQMTLALLLEATNHVGQYAEANRQGFWCKSEDFCCWDSPLTEIAGKRACIVGFGSIGSAVARVLQIMGCEVCAVTSKPATDLPAGIAKITLEEAFSTSHIISFHCPLSANTKGMVNAGLLAKANKDLIIINTARGGIVDDEALAAALHEKRIAAYCADVLSSEPPPANHPLLHAPNTFITPHIAWATIGARQRIMTITQNNIAAYLQGKPQNVVN